MHIGDRRFGEVVLRRDHLGSLPTVNPVAYLYIEEAASHCGRWAVDVRESAFHLMDHLGANEKGCTRLRLSTAMAVIGDRSRRPPTDSITDIRSRIAPSSLLRLVVDGIVSYSDTRSTFRDFEEQMHVAEVLVMLIYMFQAQEQSGELARRVAS